MVDATTPRLNLVKPEVGGSADTWGDKWNENADKIDAAIIKPNEENVWSAPQHFDGGLYDRGERVVRQSDVTTNRTDATLGRVLKVGDFGVGEPIWISQGQNLNDFITPGEYIQATNANAIPELNYPVQLAGALKVFKTTGNGFVQEYTTHGSTRRKFLRGRNDDGTWSSWVEFYHTGNDASLVKTSRTISTGTGLTGGGPLSVNRTISLASSHWPIGVGQTWHIVSRSSGTTYTNSTGRPIAVYISFAYAIWARFYVGGVEIGYISNTEYGYSISAIVPPGSTYRLEISGKVDRWAELR